MKGLEFVSNSPQLLTLGIKPNRPETGYGYIQIEEEKQGDFFKVKTFIEKPQLEFAKVFVESGEFYWNSGIFLWNINTILEAFNEIMPEVCTKLISLPVPISPLTMESWRRPTMFSSNCATSDGQI